MNIVKEYVLGVKISFKSDTNRVDCIKKILKTNSLGFEPNVVNINGEEVFEEDDFFGTLNNLEKNTGIIIKGKEGESLVISYPAGIETPLTFSWELPSYDYSVDFIDSYLNIEGFVCAYVYDHWDAFWESTSTISHYAVFQKAGAEELPKTEDRWGRKIIDISQNYGRYTLLKNFWLMAANQMWFSEFYFNTVISKDKLLKIEGAVELDSGAVHCILSKEFGDNKVLRIKQKEFRNLFNADFVEESQSIFNN